MRQTPPGRGRPEGVYMSEVSRDQERWLPVVGYEGYYEVSDQGRVRSVDREVVTRAGWRYTVKGRVLTQINGSSNIPYKVVNLSKANKARQHSVHVLVLKAFVGPPPPGTESCHSNGSYWDNRLTNLRWDSRSENQKDCVRHGTHGRSTRDKCPRGHDLRSPNLVRCVLPWRNCLACQRTFPRKYKAQRSNAPFDFQSVSDAYYRQIMRHA